MKTKTLVLFLLFLFSVVGTIFSVSSSFAYTPLDIKPDCWGGGSGGEKGPGCGGWGDIYILWCTDKKATNYYKYANVDDKTCKYDVLWCTIANDPNYNFAATLDDGSCKNGKIENGNIQYYYCTDEKAVNYETQWECRKRNNTRPQDSCIVKNDVCQSSQGKSGCMDDKALNYDPTAIVDDGSCKYGSVLTGCTDSKAGNYNPDATTEDGSCLYPSGQIGCIDKAALNFNPQANIDDGSCTYTQSPATLCLQEANGAPIGFRTVPNFSNMTTFNSLYKLCSNGGLFTKTVYSLTWNIWSFSGYCENSTSVDNNSERCTYAVELPNIIEIPAPYFITGTVTGTVRNLDNVTTTPLANIQIQMTTPEWTIQSTITDSNGNYIFNGLLGGEYSLRPDNSMPYIFPNSESVNLVNSNATINFSGIDTTTVLPRIDNEANLLNKGGDIDDWLKDLSDKWNNVGGNLPDALDVATLSNSRSNGSIFSNNSLSSLFNNWFLPLSNSYTPIPLSLVPKYADESSICGDQIKQTGETCDDGINNGKSGFCSTDCLYRGEVKFVAEKRSYANESVNTVSVETFTNISETVSRNVSGGMKILQTSIRKASDSVEESQNFLKQKFIENTSPRTREILKKTAEITTEVAQYSVVAIASVLWVGAISLNIMAYKANWISYTVKAGDTLDSIGNQFTMTERAMRAKNGLKKWDLRPGTKIKVRNRHFIEKDYLDQLKFVLQDSLEKRNYGKMSAKIEKMFAKK